MDKDKYPFVCDMLDFHIWKWKSASTLTVSKNLAKLLIDQQ